MTQTATAEHTTVSEEPDLDPQPPQNLPDVAGVPTDKTAFSLAVRRMLGLEDASDGEIELFFHVCHKSGLDPFNKEVYMIGRNTEVASWEPVNPDEPDGQKRKVVRWVTKYTIQTGINGFRKRAREIADEKDILYHQDDPLWCGEDGVWKEVWTDNVPPHAAKFVVYRDGHRYSFIAHYAEYVQTNRDGNPNQMWNKMPRNQIRKCAEAGAIQAAFPDELGGLLLEDAVQDPTIVIDESGDRVEQEKPQQQRRRGGKGVGGLEDRASAAQQQTVVDGEVVEPGQGAGNDVSEGAEASSGATLPPDSHDQDTHGDRDDPAKKPQSKMRKPLEKRLFALIGDIKPALSRDDRIDVYRAIIGPTRQIDSTNDLTDVEVGKVCDQLYQWGQDNELDERIINILMAADVAETEKESGEQKS